MTRAELLCFIRDTLARRQRERRNGLYGWLMKGANRSKIDALPRPRCVVVQVKSSQCEASDAFVGERE
eukprot:scaffold395_cov243-Pinguiococcus_pyrenoidosus.AAC.5